MLSISRSDLPSETLTMTHTKQLLLVTFCYNTAGIGDERMEEEAEGQTDVEVEIVI